MSPQLVLGLLAGLVPVVAPPAQTGPQAKTKARSQDKDALQNSQSKEVSLRVYDQGTSRAAFRACDGDADDRLSVFEARQCLERMGSLEDPEGFRQLDMDKNGQLSWPEFDRHYHGICERGGSFRLRPVRPFQPPRGPRRASAPERAALAVLQLGDKNQDSGLDRTELQALLTEFKLPEGLGKQGFLLLDVDRSGKVDQKELILLVQTVPGLIDLGRQEAGPDLESPLAGIDKSADGEVTRQELDEALRHLDPAVARWSRKVFGDADTDKDGVLTGDELGATNKKR
jgi:Ca2+-binding EF-hand superfamily protein